MLSRSNKRSLLLGILLLIVAFYILSTRPRLNTFNGRIMGTTYSVSYVSTGMFKHPVKQVSAEVQDALDKVNERFSTYLPDSELMQVNGAPLNEPYRISPEFLQLMQEARYLSEISEGAYDVTVGGLVNLWGFGPTHWEQRDKDGLHKDDGKPVQSPEFVQWMLNNYPGAVPSQQEIDEIRANVGFRNLIINEQHSTITKLKPVFIDLNSIAKGFGVDMAAKALRDIGVDNYMVEVGGEVLVGGAKPDNQPWRLAIIGPEMGQGGVSAIVEPGDKALATSGDYLNFFEVDGQRFSHTINPATGWPEAKRVAEVAIIADTVSMADAMATMFMALGDENGLELANRLGIAARFAYYTENGYETVTSEAFKPYLVK